MKETERHLILYDGVCGLCNRMNAIVLKHDPNEVFHFAALQSEPSRSILRQFNKDPQVLDTFYVVQNYRSASPRLLDKADAAIFVSTRLGGVFRLALALKAVPKFVRNAVYDLIARCRYQIFGRINVCPAMKPEHRRRFIDL